VKKRKDGDATGDGCEKGLGGSEKGIRDENVQFER
jgi:hypothetical protein